MNHSITKSKNKGKRKIRKSTDESDDDDDRDADTEYDYEDDEYGDDGECTDDDDDEPLIGSSENFKEGDFIIVKVDRKQYLCEVWDIDATKTKATCKFLRRDFSYCLEDDIIQFKWPDADDIGPVDKETVLGVLLKYRKTRRGKVNICSRIKSMYKNLN